MLPSDDKCDDACSMPGTRAPSITALAFSSLPFLITFAITSFVALHKLFPLVSTSRIPQDGEDHYLPSDAPLFLRQKHDEQAAKSTRRRMVTGVFAATIGLAAVLGELILCEISNSLNPEARAAALRITVPSLLFLLVVVIPFLELASVVTRAGWSFTRSEKGRFPAMAWGVQMIGFTGWLTGFWWLGKGLPGTFAHTAGKGLSEACLERVGVIGISLLATLSGFAAVSTPWHTLVSKPRPVTESDVARKQAGIDATNDMLATKRSRLRALQRKVSEKPKEGFVTKVMSTVRGNADTQEIKTLELEIAGLSSMALSLSSSLAILQSRLAVSQRASSSLGRIFYTPFQYTLSIYCIYRILSTAVSLLRRHFLPSSTSSTSDPINTTLSFLPDSPLDARQISFLLSTLILLLSLNSVLQTFHVLTRFMPSLLHQAQANLALLVAQISATYVISSSLMLRSNLPADMKGVVSEALALGERMDQGWVDGWFDGWFLVACAAAGVGSWIGERLGVDGMGEEWEDDVEVGVKML